ncbi:MAG: ammonium transporter [Methanomassiliicoccales archaeon]
MKRGWLNYTLIALLGISFLVLMCPVVSAEGNQVDEADTAWILVSTALVFIMSPGVALFYGGMLRKESVLSILAQCILVIGIVTIVWVVVGYSLAFGQDVSGVIGNLDHVILLGVGLQPSGIYATSIPHLAYMIFQCVFAIITVNLILGAIAERMRLRALIAFVILWTLIVYVPIAHWVWGNGGWIGKLGALDFAGGTVVHIASGVSALAAALVLGKRYTIGHGIEVPHNIPMVVLGGALLWIGWFGFNAGSALAANEIAVNAFVVTQVAAATGAITWGFISWLHMGRPGVLGLITGGVAGLVAITPAAGFVDVAGSIIIGIGAGISCYLGIIARRKIAVDDALDVWGVHGIGGTWGALATGIFATTAVNSAGNDGLISGNTDLFMAQVIAIISVWVYSFVMTFVLMKMIGLFTQIRLTKDEERIGADIIQHGESAYS